MARHKTLKAFAKALGIRTAKMRRETTINVRKAALAVHQTAVLTTPVDTGYVRSKWMVTINVPVTVVDNAESRGPLIADATGIAMSQGAQAINSWQGVGSIFVNNAVFYSSILDNGSSVQAPTGMTDHAIAAGRRVLRDLKLLKGD